VGSNLRLLERDEPGSALRSVARANHPARGRGDGPVLCVSGAAFDDLVFRQLARRWNTVRFLLVRGDGRGLQRAVDQRPRLVVMAAELGESFAPALRRWPALVDTPIVVMARRPTARDRARFLWSGASAYVAEPETVPEVDRLVGLLLEVAAGR
jgi:CheY-like chemotaxis protein